MSTDFIIAATIFAYGQTSSGKTFTIRGITENAVKDVYEHIKIVSYICLRICYQLILMEHILALYIMLEGLYLSSTLGVISDD